MDNSEAIPRLLIEITPKNPRAVRNQRPALGFNPSAAPAVTPHHRQLSYIAEILSPEETATAAAAAVNVPAAQQSERHQHEFRTPRAPHSKQGLMEPRGQDKYDHSSPETVPRNLISTVESCFASAADAAISQLDEQYDQRVAHASRVLATLAETESSITQPAIAEYKEQMSALTKEHAAAIKKFCRNEKKHQTKMTALMSEVQKTTATIQKRERAHEKALSALVTEHKDAVTAHIQSVQDSVAEFRLYAEKADKSKKELTEMRKVVFCSLVAGMIIYLTASHYTREAEKLR
ncbi:hypothetical protein HDU88_000681 [Geranomyces variabilis]|nr:hypothetical protein HDU88_000681 [Geranomyces variabilis]